METPLFDELRESLQQALEHSRGERPNLRTTILPVSSPAKKPKIYLPKKKVTTKTR